jgi:hypothetical protein
MAAQKNSEEILQKMWDWDENVQLNSNELKIKLLQARQVWKYQVASSRKI